MNLLTFSTHLHNLLCILVNFAGALLNMVTTVHLKLHLIIQSKTQNELLTSQNTIMEQMTQLTSICELACQILQKKKEEKRIEEEQAAKARYWKILACCDDDDDYDSAITPNLSTEETDNSLSMGDEHLDTIPATGSDEVIKSSVENLVPIPSEFEGIPDTMCDVHLDNNHTPLEAKEHLEIVLNSNDDISSSDDDSLHEENIEYVEAPPHDSELVSLEAAEIVISEAKRAGTQRSPYIGLERPRVYSDLNLKRRKELHQIQGTKPQFKTTGLLFRMFKVDRIEDRGTTQGVQVQLVMRDLKTEFGMLIQVKQGRLSATTAMDLALNVDNLFQADDCDAFDSDVDEAPTAQTMFMANLSSTYPIYDEAVPSYDSDILSEVHDHDRYQDAVCEHHEVHEMHDDVQPNYDVDSHPAQHVSVTTQNNVVDKSLTADLATYKEQVKLYERRARFELTKREQKIDEQLRIAITDRNFKKENLKKELHSVKMQLASTINHNKSMIE
nr:integrase, catalytic region, zinc finger, CCHC-type, peptidase aspartic, catalytic [Tanacetum cinerariifolium]